MRSSISYEKQFHAAIKDEPSVILANLTDDEFKRFHAARVPYSGSTGSSGTYPDAATRYGDVGPYIATSGRHLASALKALAWPFVVVERSSSQWTVRKGRGYLAGDIEYVLRALQSSNEMTALANAIVDELRRRKISDELGQIPPSLCEHANECPRVCPCSPNCYCRRVGSSPACKR